MNSWMRTLVFDSHSICVTVCQMSNKLKFDLTNRQSVPSYFRTSRRGVLACSINKAGYINFSLALTRYLVSNRIPHLFVELTFSPKTKTVVLEFTGAETPNTCTVTISKRTGQASTSNRSFLSYFKIKLAQHKIDTIHLTKELGPNFFAFNVETTD